MKHGIRIRMSSTNFDIVRGEEKPIDLKNASPKEMNHVSSLLIDFLNKKGFFKT